MSVNNFEIRADYNQDTIVVYQAYGSDIAKPALEQQQFVPPFLFTRMTWIKPSFLWMMERSGYAGKAGQEHVLSIRLRRTAWEYVLSQAVLTHAHDMYKDGWEERKKNARVNVQWDPERSIKGAKLNYRSIQVGISRHLIGEYNSWIVEIADYTQLAHKIFALKQQGDYSRATALLPIEKPYPLGQELQKILGM